MPITQFSNVFESSVGGRISSGVLTDNQMKWVQLVKPVSLFTSSFALIAISCFNHKTKLNNKVFKNVWYECIYFCNWTRTQNHLVLKRTLNHLVWIHSETRTWHDKNIQYLFLFFVWKNFIIFPFCIWLNVWFTNNQINVWINVQRASVTNTKYLITWLSEICLTSIIVLFWNFRLLFSHSKNIPMSTLITVIITY